MDDFFRELQNTRPEVEPDDGVLRQARERLMHDITEGTEPQHTGQTQIQPPVHRRRRTGVAAAGFVALVGVGGLVYTAQPAAASPYAKVVALADAGFQPGPAGETTLVLNFENVEAGEGEAQTSEFTVELNANGSGSISVPGVDFDDAVGEIERVTINDDGSTTVEVIEPGAPMEVANWSSGEASGRWWSGAANQSAAEIAAFSNDPALLDSTTTEVLIDLASSHGHDLRAEALEALERRPDTEVAEEADSRGRASVSISTPSPDGDTVKVWLDVETSFVNEIIITRPDGTLGYSSTLLATSWTN